MNSKILNYVLSAVVLVLGFLLFQNGCQKKNDCDITKYEKIINIQLQELDSLITENSYLKYKIDSLSFIDNEENIRIIYNTKTKVVHDTIETFKEILAQDSTYKVRSETQNFSNNTYEVTTDILYQGSVTGINIRHKILKYPINFIPPTKTYVRDNIITKTEQKTNRVLYASLDATFNKFNPENAYFGLGYKDKKDRTFLISKGVNNKESFKIQYLQPILKF